MAEPMALRPVFFMALMTCMASCGSGVRQGPSLTAKEIEHIRSLGILDSAEAILLFHSQSGGLKPSHQAGNFITNKRMAAYWIDEYDSTRTSVHSAYYASIDTLVPNYPAPWPAGTSIKVDLKGADYFNVWVGGDSAAFWGFYDRAVKEWRNNRDRGRPGH